MSSSPELVVRFSRTPRLLRCGETWTWNRRPGDVLPQEKLQALERDAFQRGREEERRVLRDAHEALRSARERLVELEHERSRALEPEVVELALHVAERIVGETIRDGRHDVAKIVRDALRGLRGVESRSTVRLHPVDLEALRSIGIREEEDVPYVADEEVPRGSCLVDTPYGTIVRDTDLLLREIRSRLHARLARGTLAETRSKS